MEVVLNPVPKMKFTPWLLNLRSPEFAALIICFIIFSILVDRGVMSTIDGIIAHYFRTLEGNPGLDQLMIGIASLGDIFSLVLIAIVLTIVRRTRKAGMVFLMAIVIISISTMYLKTIFERLSPTYTYKPIIYIPKHFSIEEDSFAPSARDFSYPSNHVAATTALAFIAGFIISRRSMIAGLLIWLFPIINSIARLYLMQHYLSDTIGGFLWGLIICLILANLLKLNEPFLMSRFKSNEDVTKNL
jgi:undecaprenyl-diphosphatase